MRTETAEASARIESLTHEGAGVARCDGKAVFIDGALPGEQVRFRYQQRKPRYDTGVVTAVLVPSVDRVVPPCPHFGVCGGCRVQHLAVAAQLQVKEQLVRDALARIGQVVPEEWAAPLTGITEGYRRKARLGVRLVPKKGGVLIGFRERRHSHIAPLSSCRTLEARLADHLPALQALVTDLTCADHIPQIEYAGGDTAAALVFRHLVPLEPQDEQRIVAFGDQYGLDVYGQSGGPDTVRALADCAPLSYALPEWAVTVRFGPTDFVQVNAMMNRSMVGQALQWLAIGPGMRVVDLFCGLGNFTLPIARQGAAVVGIEAAMALVLRAQDNAHRNGLANAVFRAADLESRELERALGDQDYDGALLDPPRTGALAAVTALAARGTPRLVYVSCNPATLARDAAILVGRYGYRLRRAGVVDMFPHTHHIESMALFERIGA
ncbi:MAG: 23S rRNA (uracil(1939)-C(5))-methyltransferase RlmD [Acidiferrobacter sp.]